VDTKVRQRLSVSKKQLNDMEVKEQCQVKNSYRFAPLEKLDDDDDDDDVGNDRA
jgi:hypothetical protein